MNQVSILYNSKLLVITLKEKTVGAAIAREEEHYITYIQ